MTAMHAIEAFPQPAYQKELVLSVLKKAAANELLTYNLYQQIKASFDDADIQALVHSVSLEDWSHYETLLSCIDHLQRECGNAPFSRITPVRQPPSNSSDILSRLEKAEAAAINFQHALCAMTIGHDYKIFDHAYALLNENIQHNLLVREQLSSRI